jgi:hypothetical protein
VIRVVGKKGFQGMASEPAPIMMALEQPRVVLYADQLLELSVVRRRVVLANLQRNGSRVTIRLHDVVEITVTTLNGGVLDLPTQ